MKAPRPHSSIKIDPVVIVFDKAEELWSDLTAICRALVHTHAQLILAFPPWTVSPELLFPFTIGEELEKMVDMVRQERWTDEWIEMTSTNEALKQGFYAFEYFYKQSHLWSEAYPQVIYDELLASMSKNDTRKSSVLRSILPFQKKPTAGLRAHYSLRVSMQLARNHNISLNRIKSKR